MSFLNLEILKVSYLIEARSIIRNSAFFSNEIETN